MCRVLQLAFLVAFVQCVSFGFISSALEKDVDLVFFVDPIIGTAGSGQTYPGVGVPFSMTKWTPQTQATEKKGKAPYYYEDLSFQGIRASHFLSGSAIEEYGSAVFMAWVGEEGAEFPTDPSNWGCALDHTAEAAHPSSYAITLAPCNLQIYATGGARAGVLQFHYSGANAADVVLLIRPNSDRGFGAVKASTTSTTVTAVAGSNPVYRIYDESGFPAGFSGHFFAELDPSTAALQKEFGTWVGEAVHVNHTEETGKGEAVGVFVRFRVKGSTALTVRVGTSFVNQTQAQANLATELKDVGFDPSVLEKRTHSIWNEHLGVVSVAGGVLADAQTQLYTALFHTALHPSLFSDADGSYVTFAPNITQGPSKVMTASGFNFYMDFSVWDVFRAQFPLILLLWPQYTQDMAHTLVAMAQQGGWLPIFPAFDQYTSEMIGDHAVSMLGEVYFKTGGGPAVNDLYKVVSKNAFQSPEKSDPAAYINGCGRRGLLSYMENGYIPMDDPVPFAPHSNGQVSRTLAYAYDDFVASELAEAAQQFEEAVKLRARADNWRNVLDTSIGFVNGRWANKSWILANPDPSQEYPWFTEGSGWTYTFFVPHNVSALVEALGGSAAFAGKLKQFFDGGFFDATNEPGHHIPYLFTLAGNASLCQHQVRRVVGEQYSHAPGGLPGNDDAGQMSAWLTFAALGFYPVCPGVKNAKYVFGTPLFSEVTLNLANNAQFTIIAKELSELNMYVQSVTLNGVEWHSAELPHSAVAAGGTLAFTMGPKPGVWP